MVLTQQGGSSAVTGSITGATALYLDIALGSHVLTGAVTGSHLELMLNGTKDYHQGACAYTIVANMSADLQGDALAGRITYSAATNRSPECGVLESCSSLQSFNGTRPPPPPTGR
jgi:hypothetical protein